MAQAKKKADNVKQIRDENGKFQGEEEAKKPNIFIRGASAIGRGSVYVQDKINDGVNWTLRRTWKLVKDHPLTSAAVVGYAGYKSYEKATVVVNERIEREKQDLRDEIGADHMAQHDELLRDLNDTTLSMVREEREAFIGNGEAKTETVEA